MNSNDVEKALIKCFAQDCESCSYTTYGDRCIPQLMADAVKVISHLRETVDDLESQQDKVYEQAEASVIANLADGGTSCHMCLAQHSKDVIQAFSEYLIKSFSSECDSNGDINICAVPNIIDNLATEWLTER